MRFADDFLCLHLGFLEVLLSAAAGGQTLGDLLAPLLDGCHEGRPQITHDDQDHREERDALND
jgi:hypothetical protein